MKNKIHIKQQEEANWFYKADHHYLSARLLYLHNLIFAAEENSALAIEMLLKCACKLRGVKFKKDHNILALWKKAKPPFILDNGYYKYLKKLEDVLYTKHPDKWNNSKKGDDAYDKLDFLYLKLREWVEKMFSDFGKDRFKTEVDLAKTNQELFNNVYSRHGAWTLATILKRSNIRYGLL
jgi:HEPN domain-containing protein